MLLLLLQLFPTLEEDEKQQKQSFQLVKTVHRRRRRRHRRQRKNFPLCFREIGMCQTGPARPPAQSENKKCWSSSYQTRRRRRRIGCFIPATVQITLIEIHLTQLSFSMASRVFAPCFGMQKIKIDLLLESLLLLINITMSSSRFLPPSDLHYSLILDRLLPFLAITGHHSLVSHAEVSQLLHSSNATDRAADDIASVNDSILSFLPSFLPFPNQKVIHHRPGDVI